MSSPRRRGPIATEVRKFSTPVAHRGVTAYGSPPARGRRHRRRPSCHEPSHLSAPITWVRSCAARPSRRRGPGAIAARSATSTSRPSKTPRSRRSSRSRRTWASSSRRTANIAAPGGISISAGALTGVEKLRLDHGIKFHGVETRPEGYRIVGKIDFPADHPMLNHFKFLKEHTRVTPKMCIPAPTGACISALPKDGIPKDVYPDMDGFFR